MVPYIVAQVLGGVAGAGILFVIASGAPGFDATLSGFASNGFGVEQLWVFIATPLAGAVLGAVLHKAIEGGAE